jgi:hypothetical protein
MRTVKEDTDCRQVAGIAAVLLSDYPVIMPNRMLHPAQSSHICNFFFTNKLDVTDISRQRPFRRMTSLTAIHNEDKRIYLALQRLREILKSRTNSVIDFG